MEEYICINLEQIKEKSPSNYNEIIKILKFIYHTIYKKNFDEEIKHTNWNSTKEELSRLRFFTYNEFVGKNNELLSILFAMYNNEDKRFAQKFFQKVNIPIDILENNIKQDTKVYQYIYNLYIVLKAYECNKNNFENFSAIIDDVAYTFTKGEKYMKPEELKENFRNKKNLINQIVKVKYYYENESLRNLLKTIIKEFNECYSAEKYERLNNVCALLKELNDDIIIMTKLEGYKIDEKLEKDIISDITLLLKDNLYPGEGPLYARNLLIGNRYYILKEEIDSVLPEHRKEVFEYLKDLNIDMFKELNNNEDEDSFTKCIKIIFDSDTYHELLEKLDIIKIASKEYKNNKELALNLLKDLTSDKHKEVINGIIISYPKDSINKITKPRTIAQRMTELYKQNDLIDQNEMELSINQSGSISEFMKLIESKIEAHSKKQNQTKKQEKQRIIRKNPFLPKR